MTMDGSRRELRNLRRLFGETRLYQINAGSVVAYQSERLKQGAGPSTVPARKQRREEESPLNL